MEQPIINEHNKQEFPPAHTAEHILNGTMVKMFGCRRAKTAHVERKKSKLDYDFPRALTPDEVKALEQRVNEVIAADMPVVMEYVQQNEVAERFDQFRQAVQNARRDTNGVARLYRDYGHTFWFYFYQQTEQQKETQKDEEQLYAH